IEKPCLSATASSGFLLFSAACRLVPPRRSQLRLLTLLGFESCKSVYKTGSLTGHDMTDETRDDKLAGETLRLTLQLAESQQRKDSKETPDGAVHHENGSFSQPSYRETIQTVAEAAETLRLTGCWDTLIPRGVTAEPKIFTSTRFGVPGAPEAEAGSPQAVDDIPATALLGELIEERYKI